MTIMIGAMTGTSMDGLDLCLAGFIEPRPNEFKYDIIDSISISYSKSLKTELRNAHLLSATELLVLDRKFGSWCAEQILLFSSKTNRVQGIAFHGSTVFHQPSKNLSFQLGNPEIMAQLTQLPIIANFRNPDLNLGGRGAPLVPFGDAFLFNSYSACLNLGGFANYSESIDGRRIASDVSFCNFIMDQYARREGIDFDHSGQLAASGTLIPELFRVLNKKMESYNDSGIALTREWIEAEINPLFTDDKTEDILHTCCEHIGYQVFQRIRSKENLLITGGGAYNHYLVSRIDHYTGVKTQTAPKRLIEMKEALIFAFLGWMRLQNRVNCLSSVTGARADHSTGSIYSN